MPNFTYINSIPAGSDIPANSQPDLQTNCASVNSILGGNSSVDLIGFNTADGGWHRHTTYVVQGSDPGSAAAQVVEYSKTSAGSSELFLQRDNVASVIQLTRGGVLASANGYTFLPGGMLLQWGSLTMTTIAETFTFPIPFTSAVYCVQATARAVGAFTAGCRVPGLTTVAIDIQSGGAGQVVYVLAIGT